MRRTAMIILAGLLVAAPMTALVIAVWPRARGVTAPEDTTRAPQWLKDLTWFDPRLWRPWSEIVIHHSAGELGDLESIDRYHRTGRHWESAGYDFIIGNGSYSGDGRIEPSSRWETQSDGAHCLYHNETSIGICLIGNFDVPDREPSPFQMRSLAQLVAYLAVRYDIPCERIYLHRGVPEAQTACPGRNFPIANFRTLVESLRKEYSPAASPSTETP